MNTTPIIITTVPNSTGQAKLCPSWYTYGQCDNGHRFAKILYCGREWCPTCGPKDSPTHKRRISRWLPKAQQLSSFGYFVFTIPETERYRFRNKRVLSDIMKRLTSGNKRLKIPGALEELGFKRGLARWHWFGDKSTKWNPHLNVLVDTKYITKARLAAVKKAWANIINVPTAVVQYEYKTTIPQKFHSLKYICRGTFLNYQWDPRMAVELYNFRNTRSWGKWNTDEKWCLKDGIDNYEEVAILEGNKCPICSSPLHWTTVSDIRFLLDCDNLLPLNAGYYLFVDT